MTINLSLILKTTRIQKHFPLSVFVFIDSLVVSASQDAGGHKLSRQNNLTFGIGLHVVGVRTVVRTLRHNQIFSDGKVTKFSYSWCFAGTLRARELRHEFSDTSPTRVKIPYTRAFHEVISILCLVYAYCIPIIVIQSEIIYRDKIDKISYMYRRHSMLTAAVLNPSTIAAINHQGAIRIKCHDATILDFFTGSLSRGCFGTN